MMKTYQLVAASLAFGLGTAGAEWTLIDNFESGGTEAWDGDSQNLQDGTHTEFEGTQEAVADPLGGNDSLVGKFSGGPEEGDNFGGAVGHSIDLPTPIEPDGVATVYFELGVGGLEQDSIFGLSSKEEWEFFWGDMESIFRVANLNYAFDVYNESGYETFGFPFEDTWYQVWMVLDNATDIYTVHIKGSDDYQEQTQAITFSGNADLTMRVRSDGPIYRFGIVQNIGTVAVPIDRDPIYLDNLFIDYSGANLEEPSVEDEGWGPYEPDSTGWVDTGDFLGWVYPDSGYLWVSSLSRSIYMPGDFVGEGGAWGYVTGSPTEWGTSPNGDGWYFHESFLGWVFPEGDYVIVASLDSYTYLPESNLETPGSWVYFYN
ncbi:MAG: hypothetical protein R6V45_09775 [Oceanipulchritudo sp.]